MKKIVIAAVCVAVSVLILSVMFVAMFLLGRSATEREWRDKTARERTPSEVRGLMQAMVEAPLEVPNFVPQSMLDDEVCSAAVCNAINFTLGKEWLVCGAAWRFPKTNAHAIARTVYDRAKDFSVVTNPDGTRRIVETFDRNFWLTGLLNPAKMYVVGYHYHDTLHDDEILDDGTGFNSHLAWLLPLKDGRRWAYHLVHRPNRWDEDPYKIEPVQDLPNEFDLVYIWELRVVLPEVGDRVVLFNKSLPFSTIRHWLNKGPDFAEYYIDTALVWLRNRFGDYEQFPVVQKVGETGFVDFGVTGPLYHGLVLGAYKGEYIHAHIASTRGPYGLEYQCVEFINRFYARVLGFQNMTASGDADSYFWNARAKGLTAYANGGKIGPQVDDIVVFDKSNHDGDPGHAAIVVSVSDADICFVQQNFYRDNEPVIRDCLPLVKRDGWFVNATKDYLPVAGWSRQRGKR